MITTNIPQNQKKTNLELFYQGWLHFLSMSHEGSYIIFKVRHHTYVEDTIKEANKRITALNLPLEAMPTGKLSNTFIVREKHAYVPGVQNIYNVREGKLC